MNSGRKQVFGIILLAVVVLTYLLLGYLGVI